MEQMICKEGRYLGGKNRLLLSPWNDDTHFTNAESEAQRGSEAHEALASSQSDTETQMFNSGGTSNSSMGSCARLTSLTLQDLAKIRLLLEGEGPSGPKGGCLPSSFRAG